MKKYSYSFMDDAGQLFVTIDSDYQSSAVAKRNITKNWKGEVYGSLHLLHKSISVVEKEEVGRNTDNVTAFSCG